MRQFLDSKFPEELKWVQKLSNGHSVTYRNIIRVRVVNKVWNRLDMGSRAPKSATLDNGLCISPKAVAAWAGASWSSLSGHRTGVKHAEAWRNKFKVKRARMEVLTEEEQHNFDMLTEVLTKPMVEVDADREAMADAIRFVVFTENWHAFRERAKVGQDTPKP